LIPSWLMAVRIICWKLGMCSNSVEIAQILSKRPNLSTQNAAQKANFQPPKCCPKGQI
jgi:hypothetical protein